REYDVGIEICHGRLLLFCSCPFFDSDGPCKHLWATVLAADKAGILRRLPAFDEIGDVVRGERDTADADAPERELDDEADEFDEDDDDDDEPPVVLPARAVQASR